MSLDNAIRFVAELSKDEDLKESLTGKSGGEVLAIAKDRGYEFTLEEFEEVCEYAHALPEGELDVEELEKVVGGFDPITVGLVIGGIALCVEAAGTAYNMGKSEGWW